MVNRRRGGAVAWLALWVWSMLAWVLLTWTATVEQLLTGALVSAAVASCLVLLGGAVRPWLVLHPARFAALVALAGTVLWRSLRASTGLAVRAWSRGPDGGPPVRPGMLLVPTGARSPAEYAAVGLLSSLVVDNQLVDVDQRRHRLQYHAVEVTSEDPEANRREINGPIERWLIRR
jgi:multicomponent Na+:H+ antiporter subunit E